MVPVVLNVEKIRYSHTCLKELIYIKLSAIFHHSDRLMAVACCIGGAVCEAGGLVVWGRSKGRSIVFSFCKNKNLEQKCLLKTTP